jgi:hypothetical protein
MHPLHYSVFISRNISVPISQRIPVSLSDDVGTSETALCSASPAPYSTTEIARQVLAVLASAPSTIFIPSQAKKKTTWARLGHYAASSGNFLPKFRDNPSVPSSRARYVIPKRR